MAGFLNRAFDFYKGIGYAPHQAAAMAGNANWESSGGNPLASGDNGTSFGLFQWRDPKPGSGRKTELFNWAKDNNLDPENEQTQLKFADYELKNSESKAGDKFFAAKDLTGANDALMGYLRPQGSERSPQGAHGYANRYNGGAQLLGLPAMTTTLAMPPTQNIGFGPQSAMQQADANPRTAGDADLAGYGDLTKPPTMGGLLANRAYQNALAMASQGGAGLLAAGSPQQSWQPQTMAGLNAYRGDPQAVAMLPDFLKRGLGLLG
jgi:hypothetical protein